MSCAKLFVSLLVLFVLSLCIMPAKALDNITPPKGGGFYDGVVNQPQVDSAAVNTVTTSYTPRYIGDWLLGKITSSNAVWVARGLTTADWSLVDGNGSLFTAATLAEDSVGASELIEAEIYTVAGLTNTGPMVIGEGVIADSTIVSADIKDGAIANADISATAAIAHIKLAPVLPGYIIVGSASSGAVAVAVSGDATLADDGTISLVETQALNKVTEIAHRVVTSYSASARVCVDFQAGLTNGQVYAYAVGTLGAVPGISATYSTTSTAQSPTSSVEVISKTISNCVIVCQEGCTVDLTLIGVR